MPCLAWWKKLHHVSGIDLLEIGSLNLHNSAEALQAARNWGSEVCSCLKMAMFLAFQSCQNTRARKAEKLSTGTDPCGGERLWMELRSTDRRLGMFSLCQTSRAKEQPEMICSVVSSTSLQTSQVLPSTIPFFNRLVRHWIRLLIRSHMNSWTRGGAKFFHMKDARWSSGWPLALRIMYRALVSISASPFAKKQIRLSGFSYRTRFPNFAWRIGSLATACNESLGTRDCCRPAERSSATVASFWVQWLNSTGKTSAKASSPS